MGKAVRKAAASVSSAEFPKSLREIKLEPYFQPVADSVCPGQIVTIDHCFNTKLCHELIKSFTDFELQTTESVKRKGYALRYNDRILLSDEETADSLWNYLKPALATSEEEWINKEFSKAVGLNPAFRVYRYKKGHFFESHYDESVRVGSRFTKWTVLIYLTGDSEFKGGETSFENGIAVHPSKGMCLLHRHGDACLLHQSELVTQGEKWVLRTDVVF